MTIAVETYSVCVDCYVLEATGDASSLDYHYGTESDERLTEIEAGFAELTKNGGYLSAGDDLSEFSNATCECCNSKLAGSRHELRVLTNDHND